MTIPMLVLTSILLLATGVILLVATRLVRALRHTIELESRIARLQEGVHLLTDTAETGFRQVATEIERLSARGGPARSGRPVAHGGGTSDGRAPSSRDTPRQDGEGDRRHRAGLGRRGPPPPVACRCGRLGPYTRDDGARPCLAARMTTAGPCACSCLCAAGSASTASGSAAAGVWPTRPCAASSPSGPPALRASRRCLRCASAPRWSPRAASAPRRSKRPWPVRPTVACASARNSWPWGRWRSRPSRTRSPDSRVSVSLRVWIRPRSASSWPVCPERSCTPSVWCRSSPSVTAPCVSP